MFEAMGRMRSAWSSIMARSVRKRAKDWASCFNLCKFPLVVGYPKRERKYMNINQRGKTTNQTSTYWNEDNCIVFKFEENGECFIYEDMNSTTPDKFEFLNNMNSGETVDVARSQNKFQLFLQGGENKSKKRGYATEGHLSEIEEISEAQETNDEGHRRASVESSDHGSSGSFSFPVLSSCEWTGCPTQTQGQECSLCGPSVLHQYLSLSETESSVLVS